jgi:hypothetical protein
MPRWPHGHPDWWTGIALITLGVVMTILALWMTFGERLY